MKYLPSAIAVADLDTVKSPFFGGEFAAYMTQVPAIVIGEIDFSAPAAATYTPDAATSIQAAGSDLQCVCITPINSLVAVVITMLGLDTSVAPVPITITATFQPPARSLNQTFNFSRGFATDMVVGPVSVPADTQRARNGAGVAQLTVPNHGLSTGMHITTTLIGGAGYNVANVAITKVDANNFTYPSAGALEATTADITGVIVVVSSGQVGSITGLQSVVGGGINQNFRIYQLPQATDYVLIEPTTEIDFNTKARVAKGVDSGMESDAYVKRGKSLPGELTIGSKFKDMIEGMARYAGQKCTAMLVGYKDGQVLGDRLVFAQYTSTVKPKLPEGDGEAMIEATGKFVDHLFFIAP